MKITLGCDPELVCTIDGQFVAASEYFKGCDAMGLDGCNNIAEIRPGYSTSPIDLTAKIRTILQKAHEYYPEMDFYAGHYHFGYPIGGHIHFGIVKESKNDQQNIVFLQNQAYELSHNLDTVFNTLELVTEDEAQMKNRVSCGYGKQSAYRMQPHGFEYRRPGSWLLSPSMTLIALSLAKIVLLNVIDHAMNFASLKIGRHNRIFLKKLGTLVKTVPDDCCEGLEQLKIMADNPVIDWNVPILENWGIV